MKKTFIKGRFCLHVQFLKRRFLPSQKKLLLIALLCINCDVYAFKWCHKTSLFDAQRFSFKNKYESNLIRGSTRTYGVTIDEWIFDKSVGNVNFYHKISGCKGSTVVFLKFENKNQYSVKVSWKEMFVTKQVRSAKAGFAGEKKLVLLPGETSSTNCEDTKNKECIILPEKAIPAYRADIEQFEFKDITVNAVQ